MPLMYHFEIPDELDKKIKHYMIDNNIKSKSDAIIRILEVAFS